MSTANIETNIGCVQSFGFMGGRQNAKRVSSFDIVLLRDVTEQTHTHSSIITQSVRNR